MGLQIERILDTRFEFSLDGGDPISDNAPNLTTFGDICHFKTKNGANIIKDQNITYADVTIIDTFGGTGSYTAPNVQSLWAKLIELNFFKGANGSGAGGGATKFTDLSDVFQYFGNKGKVPVVNPAENGLTASEFYNINQLKDLDDVAITSLIEGKVVGVQVISGVPKFVLVDPGTGTTTSSNSKAEKIKIIAEAGATEFLLTYKPNNIDLYREGQWQIQGTDYTYDNTVGKITPDASNPINEGDFFEVMAFSDNLSNKQQIPATADGQTDFNFSGVTASIEVYLKGSRLIEGTDYTRTYYSTNNKVIINNQSLIDNIKIGDLLEIRTF